MLLEKIRTKAQIKEKEILKEASKKKGYPSLNFFIIKIIK